MANPASQSPDATPQPRSDPWRIGWNILASNTLLACTLSAIALVLLITAWLPQAPDSVTNPVAFSRWLSETQARFGSSYTAMKALGIFSLAHSTALSALVGLAALCLLVRAANSFYDAWNSRSFQPLPSSPTAQTAVKTLDELTASLEKEHYHMMRQQDALYANRFPLSQAGQLAIYLGALVIIASLVITSVSGWRADSLTLGVRQMAAINVPGGQLFNLRLDALEPSGLGQITLFKETETVGAGPLAYGSPVELAGLAFSMRGAGPAIRASATLTDGQPVPLRSSANSEPVNELVLPLTRDEPDRFFAAPQAELVIRLSRGSDNTQPIRAQVYRSKSGTLLFDDSLPVDGLVNIENTQLSLQTEPYIVVDVIHSPGRPVALTGMALLALGSVVAAIWPFRQVWAIAGDNGVQLSGDLVAVQEIQNAPPSTRLSRLRHAIPSMLWKTGLAVLTCAAASTSMFHWRQGELAPTASLPLSLLTLWLAGCALAVWNRRPAQWAIVLLSLIALVVLILQLQQALLPIL